MLYNHNERFFLVNPLEICYNLVFFSFIYFRIIDKFYTISAYYSNFVKFLTKKNHKNFFIYLSLRINYLLRRHKEMLILLVNLFLRISMRIRSLTNTLLFNPIIFTNFEFILFRRYFF